jgi:two-component system sensor histidine kinase YesM
MRPLSLRQSSIAAKMFTLFMCLSILVVLLMASFSYLFYNKAVKQDFNTITGEASERLSYHLQFYLKQMAQSTSTLITTQLVQKWLEDEAPLSPEEVTDLRKEMENYISFNFPEIVNLYLVSDDKRVLALNQRVASYDDEPWFRALPSNQTTTLPTYRASVNGMPVMSMLIPVFSSQNVNMIGNLVVEFSLDEINATFQKSTLGKSGFFFMLSPDDDVIYYPNDSWVGEPLGVTDLRKLSLKQDGHSSIQVWNGKRSLVDVTKSAQTGWYIVAVVPYKEIASGLNTAINSSLITVIIMILCLVVVIPLLLHKFVGPVKKMRSALEKVARGDLSVRLEPASDISEFQILSYSFNKMVEQLNDTLHMVAELEMKEIKLQLHQQEATIQALQNQINPHLLYNTLNIISGIACLEGNPLTEKLSQNLADVYRYAASFTNREVTLQDELSILKKYLEIIHIRFPKTFESKVVIHDKFLDCRIMKLTLQPIVENAVKYGIEPSGGNGAIIVTAYAEGQDLIVEIADNGPGIDESKQKSLEHMFSQHNAEEMANQHESLGLPNVHNRIQLKYGRSYGVSIHSFPGRGTVIGIKIPLGKKISQ